MSQLGRISGQLLKDNLTRNGHDLTFDNDLLHLDVTGRKIGIKTVSPSQELEVNGTTKTIDLEVTNQTDVADITILGNTITSNTGILNLTNGVGDHVAYQAKLVVDDITVENNVISTNTTDTNLELRPNGTGNVDVYADTNIYGDLYVTGNIRSDGNITVGDQNTDNITINADVASNIIPDQNDIYTLGNSSFRWADLWVKNVYADNVVTGGLVVDNIDLNLRQGNIYYVAVNGSDTNDGDHQNDPFLTVKHALSVATSGDTVYIYPGEYQEAFPLTVPVGVSIKGAGLRSVKITPTTATRYNDAFLLNGESTVEDLTVADFFSGGNYFTVTAASAGSTTVNVGTAPFAHTYVSGGTITIGASTYNITNAVYTHTTGDLVLTHTGGTATPATTVFISNITFSCNGGNRVFPDNGYAFRFATDFAVTTRSPYIRNVTVLTKGSVTSLSDPLGFDQGDAGKGAYIDGAYATTLSKEASMLFHSVTMIVPNVDAVTATNGARIEWLNSFTYYANKGFYAYASNDGLASAGLTRLKLPVATRTGTWAVGNTVSYYDTDGTTVLASGTIDSIDGDWINLAGRQQGFLIPSDRPRKTVTVNGDAKLSTAQKKFGTSSLILDGVSDYLSLPSQADFGFGTGNFAIEAWVYPTATGTYRTLFDLRSSSGDVSGIIIGINDLDQLYFYYNGNYRVGAAGSVPINTWTHIALTKDSGNTKLWVNGSQVGVAYTDSNNYPQRGVRVGADPNGNYAFTGYIDDIRISKGVSRYTSTFTPPTTAILGDTSAVLLLHFDGTNNSTIISDDGVTYVDIRSSAGGTTTDLQVADYSDFGAEIRSIGSAAVYGNYGIYGDGQGVIGYFIGQNLAYIGNGKSSTNDPNTVIQANEVVELNNAKIYYQSVDHKGDFRIGDLFYVNQQTGEVSFTNSNVSIGTSLTFDDGGGNVTYIDATKIETGDFRISGNTVETLSQDFNVTAASGQINLQSNVTITGDLDVTGDVTVGGNVVIGNESTDTVQFVAGVGSDIIPSTDNSYDLGTPSEQWASLYTTELYSGNIKISGNTIQTRSGNADLELVANGTGIVSIPSNDVELGQDLTVLGTTTLNVPLGTALTVVGDITHTGDVTQTGDVDQTGDLTITGTLDVGGTIQFQDIQINGNVITTTVGNNDLILEAAGTGKILVPYDNAEVSGTLTVVGTTSTTTINNTGTITSGTFSTGDIRITSNSITTTVGNNDLRLEAAGTGKIYIPSNNVSIGRTLTVLLTTTLADTNIVGTLTHTGNTTRTGNVTQTGNYTLNGDLSVSNIAQFKDINVTNNTITTTVTNNNLVLAANGTGIINIPNNNVSIANNLTVVGTTYTANIQNTGTITANAFSTGDINISGNTIQTTQTNSNLQLQAAGTGYIVLEQFDVQENEIRINSGSDMVLTPNGTGIVNINSTQSIKIPVGTTLERPNPATAGMIRFNTTLNRYEGYDGSQWVRIDGVSDVDGNTYITAELTPGANDNTIRFVVDGSQVADLNTSRLNVINVDVDSININNNIISTTTTNTDLVISPNGTGALRIGNFSFRSNLITNTVNNSITYFNQTGDGYVKINSTGGFVIPVGETAERPALFEVGMMRYNTTDMRVEIWDGALWVGAGQGAGGGVTAAEAQDIGIVSAIIFG